MIPGGSWRTELSSAVTWFLMVVAAVLVSSRNASLLPKAEVGYRPEAEVGYRPEAGKTDKWFDSTNALEDPSYYDTALDDPEDLKNIFQSEDSYEAEYDGEYPGNVEWDDWNIPSRSTDAEHGGTEWLAAGADEAVPRLPQAIIIGVKKGGTRALLEFLRVHPKVRAPGPEVHFFDRHYDNGLEWYRSLMPSTTEAEMTIEKTPSYFVTKSAPARVYNMSQSARLIIVVRDPVTRAISDYTQVATKRHDLRSFAEMAFLNNATGPVATSWGAIKIGLYAKHLERWLHFFPRSQLHFVSGERLIEDPATVMAQLQDFLGLGRFVTDKHFYFNATKGFPCLRKSERTGSPHCLGKTKGRLHPTVDEKVLQRLRNFYRPFNEKFYQMTGENFGWS